MNINNKMLNQKKIPNVIGTDKDKNKMNRYR